jgi:hypothetical protein
MDEAVSAAQKLKSFTPAAGETRFKDSMPGSHLSQAYPAVECIATKRCCLAIRRLVPENRNSGVVLQLHTARLALQIVCSIREGRQADQADSVGNEQYGQPFTVTSQLRPRGSGTCDIGSTTCQAPCTAYPCGYFHACISMSDLYIDSWQINSALRRCIR